MNQLSYKEAANKYKDNYLTVSSTTPKYNQLDVKDNILEICDESKALADLLSHSNIHALDEHTIEALAHRLRKNIAKIEALTDLIKTEGK